MTGTRAPTKTFEPYVLSGQLGRAWALPFAGLLSAAGGACLYGWILGNSLCMGYEPRLFALWLLLRGVLVLGFAHAIALPVSFAGRLLLVRNAATLRLYGVLTALLGIWFAWVVYLWAVTQHFDPDHAPSLLAWLQSPAGVWNAVQALADHGVHTLGLTMDGIVPKGIWLWLPWGLEAVAAMAICMRAAPRRIQTRAFCESCGSWMRPEPTLHLVSNASPRDVRRHGLEVLTHVEPPARDETVWTRIGRQRCPRCTTAAVFRVDQVLRYERQSFARIWGGHDGFLHMILAPLFGTYEAQDAEPFVPLSWQGATEQAVLLRIDEVLAAHPLSRLPRR